MLLKNNFDGKTLCGVPFVFVLCGHNFLGSCLICPGKARKTWPIAVVLNLVLPVGDSDIQTDIVGNEGE